MRIPITCLLLAVTTPLATLALTADQKPVILSYPYDAQPSVLEDAKAAILKAGGEITHEFTLIKGFAAKASADILAEIQAWESHDGVLIEEDKVVSTRDP